MNAEEIIVSGQLELYVSGSLPPDEVLEVEEAMNKYPEVKNEIEKIEATFLYLAETVAPPLPAMVWTYVLNSIKKVKTLRDNESKSLNWAAITGWAAAILFIGGIMWMLKQNSDLNNAIQVANTENTVLKEANGTAENQLAENNQLLEVVRSKEYQAYNMPGNQAVAPQAFAKVYLNKKENIAYIDVKGLPAPPRGKVYQVWSLKMNPLTPTSVGLIDAKNLAGDEIYKFNDFPDPEAFGITLEPEGGSKTPTLSELYILGKVATL